MIESYAVARGETDADGDAGIAFDAKRILATNYADHTDQ